MKLDSCAELEARGIIAQYVARSLDEETSNAFEDHFLTCAQCQASVKIGMVARGVAGAAQSRRRSRMTLYGSVASLAAACVAGIVLWPRGGDELRSMGRVEVAPLYLGAPMRADANRAVALFDSAMTMYAARRYGEAITVFELARAAGADDPALDFFLGASQLLRGAARAAETSLTSVIDRPENLYLAEAYYYRAKARLQQNNRAGAVKDLRRAATIEGPTSDSARALLQKLEE